MKKTIFYLFVFLVSVVTSCRTNLQTPAANSTNEQQLNALQEISEKTVRVYAAADYFTFSFDASEQVTRDSLRTRKLKNSDATFERTSTLGTASLITQSSNKMAFLSCFHIFNYPDTVFQYYYRNDGMLTPFLSSVAIKEDQTNFAKKDGHHLSLEFVAHDKAMDIAILTATMVSETPTLFLEKGIAFDDIPHGAEAYISGYPGGYKMLTKAVVSKQDGNERIMLDANFNKGYSGAPFFIIHPQSNQLRLAGIVTSAALQTTNVLAPEFESHIKRYDPNYAYEGARYVSALEQIKYGITFTVTTDLIEEFIRNNQEKFREHNLYIPALMDKK